VKLTDNTIILKGIPFLCTFGSPYAFNNILSLAIKEINIRIRQLIRRKIIKKSKHKNKVENRRMIVFLYMKDISETINSSIDKREYMIGYRILNKLTAFVKRHKDKNMLEVNNNIVYKIFCNNCNASYVGQTKKQLRTRINEQVKNIGLDDLNIRWLPSIC